jgi:hypothetical protein
MRLGALAGGFLRPRGSAPVKADALRDARAAVTALAATDGPVVAGPWLAEVGYELLYWIPFLRFAVEVEPRLRERLWIVSRGGVETWYEGIASRYVELYDTFEPEELEQLREQGSAESDGVRKQMRPTALDDEILARLDLGHRHVLHPSLMFQAFRQTLKRSTLRPQDLPFRHAPLHPPPLTLELPEDFVAVRFYYRASFPESEENRALVESTLARLQERAEVVLLDPRRRYDDHLDATVAGNVLRPPQLGDPATNLAVQSAIVARARAFVGTYGGLSYLPSLLGVPSLALYSDGSRFRPQHLELARRVFATPEYGRFVAVDTSDLDLLALTLGPHSDGARGHTRYRPTR